MDKLQKVLVLGAGALKIGQSGEFDYSGSQALKALREEGVQTILVNPNIATIQTSKLLADEVYFLPVTPFFVEKIIAKERPDGILLSFGGQTALNCGIELFASGVLERYNVRILGTPISAIMLTEDRQAFAEHLHQINIPTPQSRSAETLEDALHIGAEIGFPVMVRAGFALGGQGSGIAHDREELEQIVIGALAFAPQVLIERYLHHYKEVEYEVVRDCYDNCITVCNMENMDPLGIHTGESIVIAPSQTLTNVEYHTLRAASTAIVRSLSIVGECNVQFALNPKTSEFYVIEVNARLSRSSALASKATGYPLAYVAAKLALGYGLTELTNRVTGVTQACFEPSLDYVVVKIPRWDMEKFKGVDETIGTGMKSVGEVMGIGRTFEEAYQKAIRMLDLDFEGATSEKIFAGNLNAAETIMKYLYTPTPRRIFALAMAMHHGLLVEDIAEITGIDPWFLQRIKHIVNTEQALQRDQELSSARLRALKQVGVSDKRIGELVGKTGLEIRALRKTLGVTPSVFQIDTLAAEFPSETNYLYMTYNGQHHDVAPTGDAGAVILGSGPYRIGSSVEFDWTSVSTVEALKKHGKRAIVINCNPETVSTDYDTSDRLYFEELTFERIADICEFEAPDGVIISVGGQTPNNRAKALQKYGIRLLGTDAANIDRAEDRNKFSKLLDTLGIRQPEWKSLVHRDELNRFAQRVGYPVLVRPSYVLSGNAMKVCYTPEELEQYTEEAAAVSPEYPVTVSKFLNKVKEIELDAVAQRGEVKAFVISEHIENAGVHSGDATIVLPPQTLNTETQHNIEAAGRNIAKALEITGPFNIQFLAKDNQVFVIEVNLRASRTFPFISKVTGVNFIELFVDALFMEDIPQVQVPRPAFTAVKAPQFSFSRLSGADPILRVEMSSTGEVACFGEDLEEAYLKAMLATGGKIPRKGIFISLGGEEKKVKFLESARLLSGLDIPLYATEKTSAFLRANGIETTMLYKIHEQKYPNVLTYFSEQRIDLAINIVDGHIKKEVDDDYAMRRFAVDHNIPLFTKIKQARLFVKAIVEKDLATLPVKAWSEYPQGDRQGRPYNEIISQGDRQGRPGKKGVYMVLQAVQRVDTDILIIGSGGSGLRAAIEASEKGARVLVVAKEYLKEAHTGWAMGGINVAMKAPASPQQHFEDTIKGGWYINNYKLARIFAEEMPERIQDLESYGVKFDRLPDGSYFTWASGKTSAPLNLCAGDYTGREMMQGLLAEIERLRIPYLEYHYVTKLLKQGDKVVSAFLIDRNTGTYKIVQAKATIVATGGGGNMYQVNTNAPSNTGEGYAWALDVGAELVDMEMVQFHPTGMAYPAEKRGILVTEKVRGNGGILKNKLGERFMVRYQPERLELAGRDEVTRAIYQEIQEGRGTEHGAVYLDITHWEEGKAEKLVPDVFTAHMEVGIDIRKQMMEITPSMHHMMGGYVINEWGETNVDGLYAVGEVTTSVHGANRLGGNSLAEGQVFGRRAGLHAAEYVKGHQAPHIAQSAVDAEVDRVEAFLHRKAGVRANAILRRVKAVMWNNVGIIRDAEKLLSAQKEIKQLQDEAQSLYAGDIAEQQACLEVQDMLRTAEVIILAALERKESRGAHYRSDYPQLDREWEKNIRVHKDSEGKLVTRFVSLVKE